MLFSIPLSIAVGLARRPEFIETRIMPITTALAHRIWNGGEAEELGTLGAYFASRVVMIISTAVLCKLWLSTLPILSVAALVICAAAGSQAFKLGKAIYLVTRNPSKTPPEEQRRREQEVERRMQALDAPQQNLLRDLLKEEVKNAPKTSLYAARVWSTSKTLEILSEVETKTIQELEPVEEVSEAQTEQLRILLLTETKNQLQEQLTQIVQQMPSEVLELYKKRVDLELAKPSTMEKLCAIPTSIERDMFLLSLQLNRIEKLIAQLEQLGAQNTAN